MSKTPVIGLVMIVRDEEAVIERCLQSVLDAGLVDTWTLCDTGSTDGTRAAVRRLLGHLPGRLYRHEWRSFGANRTLALARAAGTARWLLHLDADDVVSWSSPGLRRWLARGRHPEALNVEIQDHGLTYRLPKLVSGDRAWRYVGLTHEYLDGGQAAVPLNGLIVEHLGDGSATGEKLQRDLLLLKPGLEAGDPRSTFYSAETLRYLGLNEPAALLYDRRAAMEGTWEEEAWYAAYQSARLRGSISDLLEAWQRRPWRHEPLTAAARIAAADDCGAGDVLFLEPKP